MGIYNHILPQNRRKLPFRGRIQHSYNLKKLCQKNQILCADTLHATLGLKHK